MLGKMNSVWRTDCCSSRREVGSFIFATLSLISHEDPIIRNALRPHFPTLKPNLLVLVSTTVTEKVNND